MRAFLPLTLALVLTSGCATPYQKAGLGGGYDDFLITRHAFEVTFRGNSHTREETVAKYLLRRASEVTLINGFTHFLPTAERDLTGSSPKSAPGKQG